jgi:hypothetical protein
VVVEQDLRDGYRVGDEIISGKPLLSLMRGGTVTVRPLDQIEIETVGPIREGSRKTRIDVRER